MRNRIAILLGLWLLVTAGVAGAQGGSPSPGATGAPTGSPGGGGSEGSRGTLLLLQSDVGGQIVDGTGFVVKGGPASQVITSYDAVKGAAAIKALVPQHGLVDARLLKYAPEANLALLELSVPDLPAMRIGDSDMLRKEEPIEMITASPMREGPMATAMTPITRRGQVANMLSRPGGIVLQLKFDGQISDESTGAPVVSSNTGEVVGLSLSRMSAGNDAARLAVPSNLLAALAPDVAKASGASAAVRVFEGSEAPVEPGGGGGGGEGTDWSYYLLVGGAMAAGLAVVAFLALKRREKFVPFAVLPKLPDGVTMAFVDARGRLLPMDADPIKIGRAEDNHWRFNDHSVSNYHAKVKKSKTGGGWEVEDLRSTNGTFVRDRRIGESEALTPGGIVRFGKIEVMLMMRSQSNT